MPFLFFVLLSAALAGGVWLARRRKAERIQNAMCQRLEDSYGSTLPPDSGLVSLCSPGPRGRVHVSDAGLILGLEPSMQSLCLVPWKSVGTVSTSQRGALMLHIARVGDVLVPGSMGRQIWDQMSERVPTV